MRVLMLSDLMTTGGAARAASRLAHALQQEGHEVERIVGGDRDDEALAAARILRPGRIERRMVRGLRRVSERGTRAILHRRLSGILSRWLETLRPDVISVHNLHGMGWDPELVSVCAEFAPVVWTLHDMWSFTGRCANAFDCRAFITGCGAECPSPDEYPALAAEKIRPAWERRRATYDRTPRITLVAPSIWLAEEARRGLWRRHRVEVIPNSVPITTFAPPRHRARTRAELGVSNGAALALVAAETRDRRKGFRYLVDALSVAPSGGLKVAVLGNADPSITLPGIDVQRLGYIDDDARMAEIYGAADLLIHPASADNLPNVVLEAMACGTPTLAFSTGGLPDMVRPGTTGWLAPRLSADSLRDTLGAAERDLARGRNYREQCRTVAEEEYAPALQARRYAELFKEVTARTSESPPANRRLPLLESQIR